MGQKRTSPDRISRVCLLCTGYLLDFAYIEPSYTSSQRPLSRANMVSLQPALRGRIVGALSCQKDSYLQILETEVLSCIRSEPSADTHSAKSTKKNVKTANDTKSPAPPQYLIEFGDSVLFPEGKSTLSCHSISRHSHG